MTERLQNVAEQAKALAEDKSVSASSRHQPWMESVQGLLEMYYPGGALEPWVREAVREAKDLGALRADSSWLRQRVATMAGGEIPEVQQRVRSVAAVLERAARAAEPPATAPAPDGDPDRDGTTFQGWTLVESLGRGGQGEVMLVHRGKAAKRGALKRMTGPRALTETGRRRFLGEIEAFGRIRHPYVVRVLDSGDTPDPYLVTEVAPFGSLHDNLDAFRGDAWRSLRMARCVALGIGAAHTAQMVHRDVKPKNILLQSLDHPLLADFGIAHFADKESLTSAGSHPGAFRFAPAEYELPDAPTPAFDVFCLGAVLHVAMTGEELDRPYRAVPRLPSVGGSGRSADRFRAVDDLIASMTKREPADRPQTMEEVVAALDTVTEQLFGPLARGLAACTCETGTFREIGTVIFGAGTEINVFPDMKTTAPNAYSLRTLEPRLEMCSSCGSLRLRAGKIPSRPSVDHGPTVTR